MSLRLRSYLAVALILPFLFGFGLKRESSGRLTLIEKNCEQVRSTLKDFSDWKKTSDGQNGCDASSLSYAQDEERCWVDATPCLPEHVQKYHGLTAEEGGPNCWNMSLVLSKILPYHRYTSEEEFAYYMRPPLCRSLKSDEKRRPGDIGAIHDFVNENGIIAEEYAFIYINEKIAYSKNGWPQHIPYRVQSLQETANSYGFYKNSGCEQDLSLPGCERVISYFRCQSMSDYLKNTKNVPKELIEIYKKTNHFESCLENSTFTESTLSAEAIKNLKQSSEALTYYLEAQRRKKTQPKENTEEEFMIGALQLRLFSIATQLSIIEKYPNEERDLMRLIDRIKR